jgi:hypothetical protein
MTRKSILTATVAALALTAATLSVSGALAKGGGQKQSLHSMNRMSNNHGLRNQHSNFHGYRQKRGGGNFDFDFDSDDDASCSSFFWSLCADDDDDDDDDDDE